MVELQIHVNTNGLEEHFQHKADQLDNKTRQLHMSLLDAAHRTVQREAPRRTGRLKASIQKSLSGNTGSVFSNRNMAPYVDWVIEGRKGFSAKNRRALKFKINGKTIFAKHVGPSKPNPFFDRAVPSIEGQMERHLNTFLTWLEG